MRTWMTACCVLALAACSPPAEAPAGDQTPAIEPPPEIPTDYSSDGFADAMARGEGVWFRRSGDCVVTMEFVPDTNNTLMRREPRSDDVTDMRLFVEPNATRVDGANEMRWPTPDGEARFVWENEYATLLIGERRCEYSRGLMRGPRPETLP